MEKEINKKFHKWLYISLCLSNWLPINVRSDHSFYRGYQELTLCHLNIDLLLQAIPVHSHLWNMIWNMNDGSSRDIWGREINWGMPLAHLVAITGPVFIYTDILNANITRMDTVIIVQWKQTDFCWYIDKKSHYSWIMIPCYRISVYMKRSDCTFNESSLHWFQYKRVIIIIWLKWCWATTI